MSLSEDAITSPEDDITWDYTYNADGMRIGRTDGNTTYTYTYNGDKLTYLVANNHRMYFAYDANGLPVSMILDGVMYYYVTNIQGDIIGLLDANGNTVATYAYDAWGNPITTSETITSEVGEANPLRYRSYVWDSETQLYYLQSRYYNPELGRFINVDSIMAGVTGNIRGHHLFAYCFNNPTNGTDPGGNWPEWLKNTIKEVAKEIAYPTVKYVQKQLSEIDGTYSCGLNFCLSPSGFIASGQVGTSIDTKGNVATQGSFFGGLTGGKPTISFTVFQTRTNAPTIDKLEGFGCQIGGSAAAAVIYGIPLAVSADVNLIPDTELNKMYWGSTANIGLGSPGAEFHIEWGETATLGRTRFNIFDVIDAVYTRIMEWE